MALDLYSKGTTDNLLAAKLDLAGGTMTGGLTLSASGIIFSDSTYLTTAPTGSSPAADQLTAGVVTANPTAGPVADWASLYYASGNLYWSTSVAAVQISNGYATSLAANPTPGQFLKFNATSQLEWADVSGSGLPAGGAAGESLLKVDATDYNVTWGVPSHATSSEVVTATVRNNTGVTLTEGQVVYINGALGNRPTVALAQADSESTSAGTYGMVSASIPDNTDGTIVIAGYVANLDTHGFTDGDRLYLSPTVAGGWTTTKPSAPDHMVYVGVIARAHPTLGVIQLRVATGYELEELHNVSAQTPSNNDLLAYDSATSLWKNTTASTAGLMTSSTAYSTFAPIFSPTFTGSVTLPSGSVIPGYVTSATLGSYAALSGATFSGKVNTVASTTTTAGFRIPSGTAPTSPTPGDIWFNGTNLLIRNSSVTGTVPHSQVALSYGAGFKQSFSQSATTAGICIANDGGVSTAPTSKSQGDVWYQASGASTPAGIYGFAQAQPSYMTGVKAFVNFNGVGNGTWPGGTSTVTRTAGSTTATITTTIAHGLQTGGTVYALTGVVAGAYDVTVTSTTQFTITTVATTALTAASITFAVNTMRGVSYNVSSVTDLAVGQYTVNFTTALLTTNYTVQVTCNQTSGSTAYVGGSEAGVRTTGGVKITNNSGASTYFDTDYINVLVLI